MHSSMLLKLGTVVMSCLLVPASIIGCRNDGCVDESDAVNGNDGMPHEIAADPYHKHVDKMLEKLSKQVDYYTQKKQDLADAGYPENPDLQLLWLSEAGELQRSQHFSIVEAEHDIRASILRLWRISAYCDPITRYDPDDLNKYLGVIAENYRLYFQSVRHLSRQQIVSENLPSTIKAIASKYSVNARAVVESNIYIYPTILSTYEDELYAESSEEDRRKLAISFSAWYNLNSNNLIWDHSSNRFKQTSGRPISSTVVYGRE